MCTSALAAKTTDMEYQHWSMKNSFLFALNGLAIAVIVTPLCITFWWSTWGLFYNFATAISSNTYPNIGLWFIAITGCLGKFIMYLLQCLLRHWVNDAQRSRIFIAIIVRVELYVKFLINMAFWVGAWSLLDKRTGKNATSVFICLGIGLLGLFMLRSLNASLSTPMNLNLDFNQKPFHHYTRFTDHPYHRENTILGLLLYVADCIVTIPIIDSLLIAYWRAGFDIPNLYLLPHNPKLSAWISITIGYVLFILYLILQFPVVKTSRKFKSSWQRLLWKASYWIVGFIMMVCIWRGTWNILDLYIPLDNLRNPYPHVYRIIIHFGVAITALMLNLLNNNLPGFSVVDDSCLDGQDLLTMTIFPTVSDFVIKYATQGANTTQEPSESSIITISKELQMQDKQEHIHTAEL